MTRIEEVSDMLLSLSFEPRDLLRTYRYPFHVASLVSIHRELGAGELGFPRSKALGDGQQLIDLENPLEELESLIHLLAVGHGDVVAFADGLEEFVHLRHEARRSLQGIVLVQIVELGGETVGLSVSSGVVARPT